MWSCSTRSSSAHPSPIPGVPLVVADIADAEAVAATCKEHGVTQVVHFAAYKSVGESMEQPSRYWMNNVAGTAKLVDTLLGVGVNQMVFSSSCSVNGTPAVMPVSEQAPIHPESVYAESKAMVERILRWYDVTDGVRSVSLRYFNAAGASEDGQFGEVWDAQHQPDPRGDEGHPRPPAGVLGVRAATTPPPTARASVTTSTSTTSPTRTSRRSTTLPTVARRPRSTSAPASAVPCSTSSSATERITGRTVPHEMADRRAGDPVATYADPTLIRETLGWSAVKSLDDIIATAWQWHSLHPHGYA